VFQDVFDSAQLSAMTRAIDQIMEGGEVDLKRNEVAHAVFAEAREGGEFDPRKLARLTRERLAARREVAVEVVACKAASR
jgi:hypothetical protein